MVRLWEADSGRELLTLKGHAHGVTSVVFSPDGGRLASASFDGTVRLWDADSGREVLIFKDNTDRVTGVGFSPDGWRLASTSRDGTVRLWEADSVTAELRQKRAVVRMTRPLFSQYLNRREVIAHLQGDRFLSAPMRWQALALVKDWPEPVPLSLNDASWAVGQKSKGEAARYRLALRWAEEACQRQPSTGEVLNTLGVAQYRNGKYADALASLTQAESLNAKTYGSSIPGDLAFVAMAHQRFRQKDEAATDLARFRQVMKSLRWARDAESQAFR
jgi:hypothetical protein